MSSDAVSQSVFSRDRPSGGAVPSRDFPINFRQKIILKHSPQSNFRADFKYFKSFFNFNLRLKKVQTFNSIHFNFSNTD